MNGLVNSLLPLFLLLTFLSLVHSFSQPVGVTGSIPLSIRPSIYKGSIGPSICLSIHLSVHQSVGQSDQTVVYACLHHSFIHSFMDSFHPSFFFVDCAVSFSIYNLRFIVIQSNTGIIVTNFYPRP